MADNAQYWEQRTKLEALERLVAHEVKELEQLRHDYYSSLRRQAAATAFELRDAMKTREARISSLRNLVLALNKSLDAIHKARLAKVTFS